MERWRWLPRSLGARHVIVNVPAFTAALGRQRPGDRPPPRRRRRAPHADAAAHRDRSPAVTHQSLVERAAEHHPREWAAASAPAIRCAATAAASTVRQPPGPRNALGRLKIEMPNQHAIYLHDTPSQACSAGRSAPSAMAASAPRMSATSRPCCSRRPAQWDRAEIDRAIDAGRTSRPASPRRSRSTSPISPPRRPPMATSSAMPTFTAATRRSARR